MNKTARDTILCPHLLMHLPLLHLNIEVWLLSHNVGISLALVNTAKQFSTYPPHPTDMCENFSCSTFLPTSGVVVLLNFSHSDGYVISLGDFSFHFSQVTLHNFSCMYWQLGIFFFFLKIKKKKILSSQNPQCLYPYSTNFHNPLIVIKEEKKVSAKEVIHSTWLEAGFRRLLYTKAPGLGSVLWDLTTDSLHKGD